MTQQYRAVQQNTIVEMELKHRRDRGELLYEAGGTRDAQRRERVVIVEEAVLADPVGVASGDVTIVVDGEG
jgi:hypothetical protein